MPSLRTITKRSRRLFHRCLRYAANRRSLAAAPRYDGVEGPVVIADLTRPDWTRYYIPILAALHAAGLTVRLVPRFSFLSEAGESFHRELFAQPWIHPAPLPLPRGDAILLSDNPSGVPTRQPGVIRIEANDPGRTIGPGEMVAPFHLHPKYLFRPELVAGTGEAHEITRTIAVGFCGNVDPRVYDNATLVDRGGIITRLALIEKLRREFADRVLYISRWEEKSALELERPSRPIVIVNSFKAGMHGNEYFEFLRRCRFWIAAPGIGSPLAHNFPESIAAGCIPICQFPELIDPDIAAFTLHFDDLDEFAARIEEVLQFSEARGSTMSAQSTDFFQARFELKRYGTLLRDRAEGGLTLRVRRGDLDTAGTLLDPPVGSEAPSTL